ncbi:tetratricopeptide repeat protein [Altererythrobacter sp.]|uniref:tetratricopeptide repeat protein n=1 Tax=Altererythrobacter sp. TaxID=1872480 RepID=UPI003D0EB5D3
MLRLLGITAALLGTTGVGWNAIDRESDTSDELRMAALDPTLAGRKACRGIDAGGLALDARLELAAAMPLMSQASANAFPLYSGLPTSDIGVTGISGEARRYFDQGVALLFGFNHAAATRSFRKARGFAPECAMCWWGEAYANGLNINSGMSEEQNRLAIFAVKQAQRLSADSSEVEKALISAMAARFPDDLDADRGALEQDYSAKMIAIAERFPASSDIAVLAAESAMNTTPWDYWDPITREARPQIKTAIALIERAIANNPHHPQASHLYIHLMENSPDPTKAEAAADRLVDDAPPALGHLVHMPAHIYYRIGRYTDSITANIKAARADEKYLSVAGDDGLYRFGYYPHNVHFLLTSAQMAGDLMTVANETERLKRILDEDIARQLPWVQAIHAAPAFAMTQFSSPAAVLALTADKANLSYVDAMRHYARAVAYARTGNSEGFDTEIAEMRALKEAPGIQSMVEAGFPAPDIVELAIHVAQGRKSHANGKYDAAAAHYRQAQAIEKTVPYNEPPYWYYPVAQSLGASLYKAGKYKEAQAAFREALFQSPNNGWALYGLAKAETKLGNRLEARAAEAALKKAWIGDMASLRMDRL